MQAPRGPLVASPTDRSVCEAVLLSPRECGGARQRAMLTRLPYRCITAPCGPADGERAWPHGLRPVVFVHRRRWESRAPRLLLKVARSRLPCGLGQWRDSLRLQLLGPLFHLLAVGLLPLDHAALAGEAIQIWLRMRITPRSSPHARHCITRLITVLHPPSNDRLKKHVVPVSRVGLLRTHAHIEAYLFSHVLHFRCWPPRVGLRPKSERCNRAFALAALLWSTRRTHTSAAS